MKRFNRIGAAVLLVLALAFVAQAQDKKGEPTLKTVHGEVSDKSDNPAPGSVVFLKNTRNNQVRSYIADESGLYRFSGLDPNTDYEIHAEREGTKSQTRSISSFDTRKDVVMNLKLEKKKD